MAADASASSLPSEHQHDPARVQAAFARFAEVEVVGRSPLYEVICAGVAADPELIAIAARTRRGQLPPNMLLAAVHYLLLRGAKDPLATFYPDLTPDPRPREQVYPYFRAFVLAQRAAIEQLLQTRLVQTAQVRRCTALVPAFALIHARAGGAPLALIEVGPSAGLNLIPDRYAYRYSNGARVGGPAPLTLTSELRGEILPPLPATVPPIAFRLGLDLNPIDVHDDDAVLWLRALIWPGEEGRAHDLEAALTIVRDDPPELVRGDAVAMLPAALDRAPAEAAIVVYHSHTLVQFSREARERFDQLLREHARRRPLWRLAMEFAAAEQHDPSLDLFSYSDGDVRHETLATCDAHGAWLAWSGPVV